MIAKPTSTTPNTGTRCLVWPTRNGDSFAFVTYRHPVTNEYLPSCLQGEIILRKEGDVSDKLWDEDALRRWEEVENGGQEWAGRLSGR